MATKCLLILITLLHLNLNASDGIIAYLPPDESAEAYDDTTKKLYGAIVGKRVTDVCSLLKNGANPNALYRLSTLYPKQSLIHHCLRIEPQFPAEGSPEDKARRAIIQALMYAGAEIDQEIAGALVELALRRDIALIWACQEHHKELLELGVTNNVIFVAAVPSKTPIVRAIYKYVEPLAIEVARLVAWDDLVELRKKWAEDHLIGQDIIPRPF